MGGGTCYKGGWLPAGMTLTVTGTLRVVMPENSLWYIQDQDGIKYTSSYQLTPEQMIDGAIVSFKGLTMPSSSGSDGVIVVNIQSLTFQK